MPSLGLCWLAAACRAAGQRVEILDASASLLDTQATASHILSGRPKLVGFTATTCAINSAAETAAILKKHAPDTLTVVGGPHATAIPQETLDTFPQFDIAAVGEGEKTLVELVECCITGKGQDGVSGIVMRDGFRYKRTPQRQSVTNLDLLPFPAWDLLSGFPSAYRSSAFRHLSSPAGHLVTSRGCPMTCAFCDRSVFGRAARFFSVDYVYGMIETMTRKFGVREIAFEDDCFTVRKSRVVSLCERLLQSNLRLSWSCLGRVDMVDDDMLRLMKRAGCWQIAFGIESGDEFVLESMRKKVTLDQIRRTLELTRKCGILTKGFFLVGYPTDTRQSIAKSIAFAKASFLRDISVSQFTPFPGTEVYDSLPLDERRAFDWRRMNLMTSVYVPKGLTKELLTQLTRRFLREFYVRPRIIFSYVSTILRHPKAAPGILRGLAAFLRNVLAGAQQDSTDPRDIDH